MGNTIEAMNRKYLRVLADMEVEVCLLPQDESHSGLTVFSCRARDISGGGLSFYGEMLFPEFSLLRLRIPLNTVYLPSKTAVDDIIKVMGKVVWSRRKKDDTQCYATGVQFLNIYEGDFKKLEQIVLSNLSAKDQTIEQHG